MNADETPQETAARIDVFLREECEGDRDPEDYFGYMAVVFDPKTTEGAITYCSNVDRSVILQFLEEFIERNKPARGRNQ